MSKFTLLHINKFKRTGSTGGHTLRETDTVLCLRPVITNHPLHLMKKFISRRQRLQTATGTRLLRQCFLLNVDTDGPVFHQQSCFLYSTEPFGVWAHQCILLRMYQIGDSRFCSLMSLFWFISLIMDFTYSSLNFILKSQTIDLKCKCTHLKCLKWSRGLHIKMDVRTTNVKLKVYTKFIFMI